MRYVHADCLNQWRLSSVNKNSFYECDSCKYRYSFKRARYAQLLRSALLVNLAAIVIFTLIIVAMSYISLLLDWAFFDGGLASYFTPSFDSEQWTDLLDVMEAEDWDTMWFNRVSLLGLNVMQLLTGEPPPPENKKITNFPS